MARTLPDIAPNRQKDTTHGGFAPRTGPHTGVPGMRGSIVERAHGTCREQMFLYFPPSLTLRANKQASRFGVASRIGQLLCPIPMVLPNFFALDDA